MTRNRLILPAGIHDGIPMQDYLADPCPEPGLSRGCIKSLISETAEIASDTHPRLGTRAERHNKIFDEGTTMHCLLMGQEHMLSVLDFNDYRTKAAKAARDEAYGLGLTPYLEHKLAPLREAAAVAKPLLDQFGALDVEQTIIWQGDGYWARTRPDLLSSEAVRDTGRGCVVEYKTAESADPKKFEKKIAEFGYDIQAGMGQMGLAHICPGVVFQHYWLVQEKVRPWRCSVVFAGLDVLELAQRKIDQGIKRWKQCLGSGDWPGYPTSIETAYTAEPVSWDVYDFEGRVADSGPAITFGGEAL
jgi:hypothetical protein